jgi:hypothetical protein
LTLFLRVALISLLRYGNRRQKAQQ